MNVLRERINFREIIPPSIVEEVLTKQKYENLITFPTLYMTKKYLLDIGFHFKYHATPEFYQRYLMDIDVPVSISVQTAYKVIQEFGYGVYISIKTGEGVFDFLRFNKEISKNESIEIKQEILNRVKCYELEFYKEYIQPTEHIEFEPTIYLDKDWWFANKPRGPLSDEIKAKMADTRQRNRERKKAERKKS